MTEDISNTTNSSLENIEDTAIETNDVAQRLTEGVDQASKTLDEHSTLVGATRLAQGNTPGSTQNDATEINTEQVAPDQIDQDKIAARIPSQPGATILLPVGARFTDIIVSGDDLLFRQADGTLIVIEDGLANLNALSFVVGGVAIPGTQLAQALQADGITVPAAGPGSTTQGSGGNFEQDPGNVGDPFDITPLLDPTALAFSLDQVEDFQGLEDDAPTLIDDAEMGLVEEDNLMREGGDSRDPQDGNDEGQGSIMAMGSLNVDFGNDGFGALIFTINNVPPADLTSNGLPLIYVISPDGTVLEAFRGEGELVFRVELQFDEIGAPNGKFLFELFENLDHSIITKNGEEGSTEDFPNNLNDEELNFLDFEFDASDSNGDAIVGGFQVKVQDDIPEIDQPVQTKIVMVKLNKGVEFEEEQEPDDNEDQETETLGHDAPGGNMDLLFKIPEGTLELQIDITDIMTRANFDNSLGYYFADADGNPVFGGAIIEDGIQAEANADGNEFISITNIPEGAMVLGFFIIPNGNNANSGLAEDDPVFFEFNETSKLWEVFKEGETDPLNSAFETLVLFSDHRLNPDEFDAEQMGMPHDGIDGNKNSNWEDSPFFDSNSSGGLQIRDFNREPDFNDVQFNIMVTAKVEVENLLQIDEDDIDTFGSDVPGVEGSLGNSPDDGDEVDGSFTGDPTQATGGPANATASLGIEWGADDGNQGEDSSGSHLILADAFNTTDDMTTITLEAHGLADGDKVVFAGQVLFVRDADADTFKVTDGLDENGDPEEAIDLEAEGELEGLQHLKVVGDRSVIFDPVLHGMLGELHDGTPLTSKGDQVTYQLSADGTELIAFVDNGFIIKVQDFQKTISDEYEQPEGNGVFDEGDRLVFKVTLSDLEDGSAKFELYDQIDHPNPGVGEMGPAVEDQVWLKFGFIATDSDGDMEMDVLTVDVKDDIPELIEKIKLVKGDGVPEDVHEGDLLFAVQHGVGLEVMISNLTAGTSFEDGLGIYFADANGNPLGGFLLEDNVSTSGGTEGTTVNGDDIPVGAVMMGFFVLPDANDLNSLPENIDIIFEADGNGFFQAFFVNGDGSKGAPITTEDGFVLFSDRRLNPNIQGDGENQPGDFELMGMDDDDLPGEFDSNWENNVTSDNPDFNDVQFDVMVIAQNKVVVVVDEDDIDTVNRELPGQDEGSLGTSPDDGNADGSFTGNPNAATGGPAFVSGTLAGLIAGGADEDIKFAFVNEAEAREKLEAIGLRSKGAPLSFDIQGNVLYGFDNDFGSDEVFTFGDGGDRLVFRLTLNEDGSFTFELFDQMDHDPPFDAVPDGFPEDPVLPGDNPPLNDQNFDLIDNDDPDGSPRDFDISALDFGSIIKVFDFDGDTITLDGQFSVKIRDDVPELMRGDEELFFSLSNSQSTLGGLTDTAENEDIIKFDGDEFSTFFEGDNGSEGFGTNLDAATWTQSGNLLFSISGSSSGVSIGGVSSVEGNDIVKWDGSEFSLFFEGGSNGVFRDIDALSLSPSGNLLFSIDGSQGFSGITGTVDGNDIVKWDGSSFSLFFDGGSNGVHNNIDGISFSASGNLLFSIDSTQGFTGITGTVEPEDIVKWDGENFSLFFDGSENGVNENIDAITVHNEFKSVMLTVDEDDIDTFGDGLPGGSHGTSVDDGDGDGSFSGNPNIENGDNPNFAEGPANASGDLSAIVTSGADEDLTFMVIAADDARAYLDNLELRSQGDRIVYDLSDSGEIIGFVNDPINENATSFDPQNGDRIVFRLTISEAGEVTFELFDQMDHDPPYDQDPAGFENNDDPNFVDNNGVANTMDPDADQNTDLIDNDDPDGSPRDFDVSKINFGAVIKAVDFDGDAVLLDGVFGVTIRDDIPDVTARMGNRTLTIDESNGNQDDDVNLSDLPADVQALFNGVSNKGTDAVMQTQYATENNVVNAIVTPGADEPASVEWSLVVNGTRPNAGVQTTSGRRIELFEENGLVVGRFEVGGNNNPDGSGNEPAAFAIHIADDGTISIVQFVSLKHPDGSDSDDRIELPQGILSAQVKVTDFDGDMATDTIDLGGKIRFDDDGPDANDDMDMLVEGEGNMTSGNVVDGTDPDADPLFQGGQVADSSGADNPGTVTGISYKGVAKTVGVEFDTDLGSFIINEDGSYKFTSNGGADHSTKIFRDEFEAQSYGNNDGTANWTGDWFETREDGGTSPTSGDIQIGVDGARNVLILSDVLGPTDFGDTNGTQFVLREADLSGATEATLSFEFRRESFESSDTSRVFISDDGGASFQTIFTFGAGDDANYQTFSIDLHSLGGFNLTDEVLIAFEANNNFEDDDFIYIDNVQIETDAPNNPSEAFEYTLSDAEGDSDTAILTIELKDTVPDAKDDMDMALERGMTHGNVITGIDPDDVNPDIIEPNQGELQADMLSADNPHVICEIEHDGMVYTLSEDGTEVTKDGGDLPAGTTFIDGVLTIPTKEGGELMIHLTGEDAGEYWYTAPDNVENMKTFGFDVDDFAQDQPWDGQQSFTFDNGTVETFDDITLQALERTPNGPTPGGSPTPTLTFLDNATGSDGIGVESDNFASDKVFQREAIRIQFDMGVDKVVVELIDVPTGDDRQIRWIARGRDADGDLVQFAGAFAQTGPDDTTPVAYTIDQALLVATAGQPSGGFTGPVKIETVVLDSPPQNPPPLGDVFNNASFALHSVEAMVEMNPVEEFIYTLKDNDGSSDPATLTIEVKQNPEPMQNDAMEMAVVEEEDLPEGNPDTQDAEGNDTDPDPAVGLVATGSLAALVDFGADGPGANGFSLKAGLELNSITLPSLTSQGETVEYHSDGTTLTGFVDSGNNSNDLDDEDRLIFTLALQADGSYIFTVLDEIDHDSPTVGGPLGEETEVLNLTEVIQATDANGDTIMLMDLEGGDPAFSIKWIDDVPRFQSSVNGSEVDEDAFETAGDHNDVGIADGPGDDTGGLTAGGSLEIAWGADDHNDNQGGLGDRMVFFSDPADPTVAGILVTATGDDGQEIATLRSGGDEIFYALLNDNTTLIGFVGDENSPPATSADASVIFSVDLSDGGNGSYTFTLQGVLDHPFTDADSMNDGPETSWEDNISLEFNFSAKDADGDVINSFFAVDVDDDSPMVHVGEDDMVMNVEIPSQGDIDDEETITAETNISGLVDFGADGPAEGGGFAFKDPTDPAGKDASIHVVFPVGPPNPPLGPETIVNGDDIVISPGLPLGDATGVEFSNTGIDIDTGLITFTNPFEPGATNPLPNGTTTIRVFSDQFNYTSATLVPGGDFDPVSVDVVDGEIIIDVSNLSFEQGESFQIETTSAMPVRGLDQDDNDLGHLFAMGELVQYTGFEVDGDGNTILTATANGDVVFTITLTPEGAATYEQFKEFDVPFHPDGPVSQIKIDFGPMVNASDFDGDTVMLNPGQFLIKIDVEQEDPIEASAEGALVEEEHGIPGGIDDDIGQPAEDLDNNGDLNQTTNMDTGLFTLSGGDGTFELSFDLSGGTAAKWSDGENVFSNSEQVMLKLDGDDLVGFVPAGSDPEREVFRVELTEDVPSSGDQGYKFTLIDNLDHHDQTVPVDHIETVRALNLGGIVKVESGSADPVTIDTLNVDVIDDIPETFAPASSMLENSIQSMTALIDLDTDGDIDNNIGADQIGTISFANITNGDDSGVTSGGDPVLLFLVDNDKDPSNDVTNPPKLEGRIGDANGTLVFDIVLNHDATNVANDTYKMTIHQPLDLQSEATTPGVIDNAKAGNNNLVGVGSNDANNVLDFLISGSASVNTNNNTIGIGTGQRIDNGETARIDFIDTLTDDGANPDPNFSIGGTVNANMYTQQVPVVNPGNPGFGNATMTIRAVATDGDLDFFGDASGESTVAITEVKIFAADGTTDITGTFGGTIQINAGLATITGLEEGEFFKITTNSNFNAVEIAGGNSSPFKLGNFTINEVSDPEPVDLAFDLTLTDNDGDMVVVDDALNVQVKPANGIPIAKDDMDMVIEGGGEPGTFELVYLIDVSGSISNTNMVEALEGFKALTQAYKDESAEFSVEIIRFRGTADAPGTFSFSTTGGAGETIDDALDLFQDAIDTLIGSPFQPGVHLGSDTNYEAGLDAVKDYLDNLPVSDVNNVFYWFTDGDPTVGGITNTTNMATYLADDTPAPSFNTLITDHELEIHAFGVGGSVDPAILDVIDNTPASPTDIDDFSDLESTLLGTISDPTSISGNVLDDNGNGADMFGPDGMGDHIVSLTHDGTTYEFTPGGGGGTISNTGGGSDGEDLGNGTLQLTTAEGGTLIFHFTDFGGNDKGDYEYTPPADVPGDDPVDEEFGYVIEDGNGDQDDATLTVTVKPSLPPEAVNDIVLTNIVDGSDIVIPDAAMLFNDMAGSGPGPLTIESVQNPNGGTVDLGSAVFSPTLVTTPATAEYRFTDVTAATAAAGGHRAGQFEFDDGDNDALLSIGAPGSFTANLSNTDYNNIESSNNVRFQTNDPGNSDNAVFFAEFDIAENPASITSLVLRVEARQTGTPSTNEGIDLGIYNYTSGQWEILDEQRSTSDVTFSETISSNPGNYVSPAGKVTLALYNEDDNSDNGNDQRIQVDNVELDVNHEITDPFAAGDFDYTMSDGNLTDDAEVDITATEGDTVTGAVGDVDEILIAKDGFRQVNADIRSGSIGNAGTNQFGFAFAAAALAADFIKTISIDISSFGDNFFDLDGGGSLPFTPGSESDVTLADVESVTPADTGDVLTVTFVDGAFTEGELLRFGVDVDPNDAESNASGWNGIPFSVTFSDGMTLNGNYASDGSGGVEGEVSEANGTTLIGNGGNDYLVGGDGNDILEGGEGDDILAGGLGLDTLQGDGGVDTFVLDNFDAVDIIADFEDGEFVDISDLLEGVAVGDLDTPAEAAEFVRVTDSGGDKTLEVDTDGGVDDFDPIAALGALSAGTEINVILNDDDNNNVVTTTITI